MRVLGELESAVMAAVWRSEAPLTVREVHDALARDRDLAYTTVMTVMERLWRKGLLRRSPSGRAFRYAAELTEPEYTAKLMHELLGRAGDRRGALAHFVHGMRRADEEEIRRLAGEASRRKRRP